MQGRIAELVARKRAGKAFSAEEIGEVVSGVTDESLTDAEVTDWLRAVFDCGMDGAETTALTHAMLHSGTVLQWPDEWAHLVVDKHSTGGVGDKTSLPLAPALAACGLKVPMISGRGLGHTGGTLDKLESLPGYRVTLSMDEIQDILEDVGCLIAGQTDDIAPADRRMYALRDVTGTVASNPLITGSIVCKKAAENPRALVL
ncbi:MAG: thymidine phosphorylase, partial [Candidatus Poseidoniales archaeon]|nr:thymidine phosphorylase [Candidatus Poseidoniales archaeon]